ncbi:uncharacterized protein LOC113141328 isoform X2 [Mastacembelus armatus]|uniref:uncharacterized protein LOC113141328 isoform X2 n=1 Tax=Mastacembelus armatus TaxID=205130 RepID=UPI000E4656B5|nr:uncharacterized protein LOC113141328 isoform X2 [Mastacembelus armatus]
MNVDGLNDAEQTDVEERDQMKRKRRSTTQRVIYTECDDDDDDDYNKKKKKKKEEDYAQTDNEQPGPSDQTHNKGTPVNIIYIESDDDDDDDYNKKKKKEEDYAQTDNEQPGPSDQTHNKGTPVNKPWDVTCGNKRGILHRVKLARGDDCILCEGSWFSPTKFEKFGGKGSSKKWKSTIFHKNKPLQYFLDQKRITVGVKKKTTKKTPKVTSACEVNRFMQIDMCHERFSLFLQPKIFSESESSAEESPEDTEEEDDDKDDDWRPNSEGLVQEAEEGEEKRVESEDEEAVEMDKNGEDGEPKLNIPPYEKSLLKDARSDHQPSCREHLLTDSLHDCGEAQSEEQSEPNTLEIPDLSVTPDTHEDPPQMSGPHITAEEFIQSNERKDPCESHGMSGSESSAAGKMSDVSTMTVPTPLRIKEERLRQLTENLGQADATTSGHDAARLEEMAHETTLSHTTESSDTVERPDFRSSANIDLDTMDLDQLKREKIKMQLKVLKLEQEYYTLKIRKLKKDNVITQGQSSFNS